MSRPVDATLIAELFDRHAAALGLYAAQWTTHAEDCVQESLLELARQRTAPENPAAWLYRVVRNRALNASRAERRRATHEQAALAEHERRLSGPAGAPNTEIELRDALASIEPTSREIVVLRVWVSSRGRRLRRLSGARRARRNATMSRLLSSCGKCGRRRPRSRRNGNESMSDELRLPDELAACEARLAALPLASSRIDRDELIYRAGWAAAEAARVTVNPPTAKSGVRGGTLVAWSAASAALAASLAVAATLALQPQAASPSVAAVPEAPTAMVVSHQAETPDSTLRTAANRRVIAQLDALASGRSSVGGRVPSAALLAALGDRERGQWDQPILVSTTATGSSDGPPRKPATARQMLNEYLPGAAPSAVAPGADPRGGLLRILNPSTWSVDAI